MLKEQAELMKSACDVAGTECEIHDDYSGRGMYGRTTFAVVVPSLPDLLQAVWNYLRELDEDSLEDTPRLSKLYQDDMGRDVIVY